MAELDFVKDKLRHINDAKFQKMLDAYLNEIGYNNIVCLGSVPNMEKTKLGTPDTYCCLQNGEYVFVEYTTQQSDLYNKIKKDIEKCIQVPIPHESIRKILYYHNSANLKPEEDKKLKQYSLDHGIELEIFGIDAIAVSLYPYHQYILKEYLDISATTGQIRSVSDFVRYYDRSPIVAPLSTKFISREKEFNDIDQCFLDVDVVLLTGEAGVGKTRFALEYVKQYSEKHNAHGLVIKSNDQEIYDELYLFLNKPVEYIILIDDANELHQFGNVIEILRDQAQDRGFSIKMLITVRRYAQQTIKSKLNEIVKNKEYHITNFTREQCEQLIQQSFGNLTPMAIEQIHKVSRGNARLAYLMARTATESNSIFSICNVSNLYDQYYGSYIQKAGMKTDDDQLYLIAGILAFCGGVNLDELNPVEPVLSVCHLTKDIFRSGIQQLHRMEIIDIQFNKAARFSDQCLGNYFLKLTLLDKKWIQLSELIRLYFSINTSRITNTINILLNIFYSEDNLNYVRKHVELIWYEWKSMPLNVLVSFLDCFGSLLPVGTLVFLDEYVDSLNDALNDNALSLDEKTCLRICGRLFVTENTSDVIDIFLKFYQKRSACYSDFYNCIKQYFGPFENTLFNKTNQFVKKLMDYSEQWKNQTITLLALDTINHFLGFEFECFHTNWDSTFSFGYFSIRINDNTREFRKELWKDLLEISRIPEHQDKVSEILYTYCNRGAFADKSVVEYDLDFIIECLSSLSEQDKVLIAHIAHSMIELLKTKKIIIPQQLLQIQNIPSYKLFCSYYRIDKPQDFFFNYNECEKKISLETAIKKYSKDQFIELIEISARLQTISWLEIENSSLMGYGLEALYHIHSFFREAAVEAINLELNIRYINPHRIINLLFNSSNDDELWCLLYTKYSIVRFNWTFEYFVNLPEKFVDNKNIDRLLLLLEKWYVEKPSSLQFVDRFKSIDININKKIYDILSSKSENEISNYYSTLFLGYMSETDALITNYQEDLELLENMYCITKLHFPIIDGNGDYLIAFQKRNPKFVIKYIEKVVIKDRYYSHHRELHCFLNYEDYISIMDLILEYLTEKYELVETYVLKDILNVSEDRMVSNRNNWIKHAINRYCQDSKKMYALFDIISSFSDDERVEHIKYFIDQTMDIDSLKMISIISRVHSWSGSEVPVIMKDIHFIDKLITALQDAQYLKIRYYLNEEKKSLISYKQSVEIKEVLYGI